MQLPVIGSALHWTLSAGLVCAGATAAFAQDPGTAPAPAPAPAGADGATADPQKPKKKLPKDRVVAVFLKNGNIVRGYALDNRLYEAEVRITAAQAGRVGFKAQEAYEIVKDGKVPGAGIRVWYPNNSQGFLFISYKQIERVDAGRVLTRLEQQRLFATIRAKEAKIAEAAAKLRAQAAAKDEAEAAIRRAMIEESIAKSKGLSVEDDRKNREDLLTKFPPSEGPTGWNAARKSAVERKLTVLGIVPTGAEQEFLKVYSDWHQAKSEADQLGWKPPGAGASAPPEPAKAGDAKSTATAGGN